MIDDEHYRQPDLSISSTISENNKSYLIHSQSRGLYEYGDYIYHFTQVDLQNRRVFGVEVFDRRLNPIGYDSLKSIPITNKKNNYLAWFVDDVDPEGNFYMQERYPDGTSIRVFNFINVNLQQR